MKKEVSRAVKPIPVGKFIQLLVVIAIAAVAFYFFNENRQLRDQSQDGRLEQSQQILAEVESILLNSNGAEAQVTVIDRPEVLRADNPEFYADAQTDDYLILYPQRAVIYRASEEQIINVAPIISGAEQVDDKNQELDVETEEEE